MMPEYVDQLNREVVLMEPPKKIVSLVPSQTELLYDLGLRNEVTGITKFCIHPDEWFRTKTRIGGTKKINFEKIDVLNPDLVIGNKEENDQGQVETLMKKYPVWMSDIKNLEDALVMIRSVGTIVDRKKEASELSEHIQRQFNDLASERVNIKPLTVAYLIWNKPIITVGGDTFIHDMLLKCGFQNAFADTMRYPEITMEDLSSRHPDLIFLSSEPYPFREKHLEEFASLLPLSKPLLTDGEFFSWYGSRLVKAVDYFRTLIRQIHSRN